jgi:hypothetical protein
MEQDFNTIMDKLEDLKFTNLSATYDPPKIRITRSI